MKANRRNIDKFLSDDIRMLSDEEQIQPTDEQKNAAKKLINEINED